MKYVILLLFFILFSEVNGNCYYHQSSYSDQGNCEANGLHWLTPPTHPDGNCYADISGSKPTFDDCCVGYADDCASGNQAVWVGPACTVGPGGGACQNGGTAAGNDPYCTCTCTADYMGDNCETLRGCHPTGQAESFVVSDTGSPVPDTDPLYITSAAECQAASDTYVAAGGSVQSAAIGNYPWHETPEGCVAQVNSNTGQISRFYWNDCAGSPTCTSMDPQVCDNTDAGGNIWKCVRRVCTNLAPEPDYYLSQDPEANPTGDDLWFTQDVACGVGNFVTLTGANADWSCKSCNGDGSNTGKELFLEEYTYIRETGAGKLHGKCCINGHHRVCQQLLEYYKYNCDDTDKGHVPNRVCT